MKSIKIVPVTLGTSANGTLPIPMVSLFMVFQVKFSLPVLFDWRNFCRQSGRYPLHAIRKYLRHSAIESGCNGFAGSRHTIRIGPMIGWLNKVDAGSSLCHAIPSSPDSDSRLQAGSEWEVITLRLNGHGFRLAAILGKDQYLQLLHIASQTLFDAAILGHVRIR